MIDFTNCKKFNKSYGGANGNKINIEYMGEKYMLKFPSKPTKKDVAVSYSNSAVCEYLSCHVFELVGIPVQKTLLGFFNKGDKVYSVVACKDFAQNGWVVQDFASLKNQIIDSERHGYGTDLADITDTIEKQTAVDTAELKKRFWEMFVVDALLGNFDRHNGNWGFIYNEQTDELRLSPVFDCGSCLFPQADEEIMKKVLGSDGEINSRVYNIPLSAIKINGKKLNYYDYLTSTTEQDCISAIMSVFQKIDINKIKQFICEIDGITELQKEFYTTMLSRRYEKIIVPAYKRAKDMQLQNSEAETEDEFEL